MSNSTKQKVAISQIVKFSVFFLGIMLIADYYMFGGLKIISSNALVHKTYWLFCAASYVFILMAFITDYRRWVRLPRDYVGGIFVALYIFKFVFIAFLLFNDALLLAGKSINALLLAASGSGRQLPDGLMSRSKPLLVTGALTAFIPFIATLNGIFRNAYNYRTKRVTLPIPNLPKALEGLTIVQISDIHAGSLSRREPIHKAVESINKLQPDLVFFTGDLVNMIALEAVDFVDVFGKIKAKYGVFSITGNHDYGDYVRWQNPNQKRRNFEHIKRIHRQMGWQLLLNQHQIITFNACQLAIIGVENWSARYRQRNYGKLSQAYAGCETAHVKLLLSHDPSHWQAEVLPKYPNIAAMFSGHTHGLQFGINLPFFKWSPVQWVYKEWYGLYTQNEQHLYVNPGFGYVGLPGRVGFLPEITHFTLKNKKHT